MTNDEWEWVQRIAGGEGIGNYPASREALKICVDELIAMRWNDDRGKRYLKTVTQPVVLTPEDEDKIDARLERAVPRENLAQPPE